MEEMDQILLVLPSFFFPSSSLKGRWVYIHPEVEVSVTALHFLGNRFIHNVLNNTMERVLCSSPPCVCSISVVDKTFKRSFNLVLLKHAVLQRLLSTVLQFLADWYISESSVGCC